MAALTDEPARIHCPCPYIHYRWPPPGECKGCHGTGIDPGRRAQLEELFRRSNFNAWAGCRSGATREGVS